MKKLLLLLVLFSIAFAGGAFSGGDTNSPDAEVAMVGWLRTLLIFVAPLIITLIVIAAVVYVVGQLFGAELRARASVYASSLLTAAGIGALVLVIFFMLLPSFTTPIPSAPSTINLEEEFGKVKDFAESALIFLIVSLSMIAMLVFVVGNVMGAETRSRANVWATGMLGGAIVAAVIYVLLNQIVPAFGAALSPFPFGLGVYFNVIITIVFMVSFIILITYLISKIFKVPEWEAYLSIELSQLLNSFLVMIFIVGLFATGQVVAASISGTTASPPLAAAQFLREWVSESVLTGLFDVFTIQTCTSILSTFSRRIGEMVLTNVYKVFPGMDTFVSISNVLSFGLMSVYGSLSFQVVILTMIDAFAVPLLLPGGLLLRFFPPTRDAGSFLIALAFSLQLVFPATFLIHKAVLEDIDAQKYNSPRLLIASICGPFKYGVAGLLISPGTGIFQGPLLGVGQLLASIASETTLNLVSMTEFIPLLRMMSLLSLLALFMPGLSTIIMVAFINGMSKFLVSKV
ncbi:MAG: hypothetical protein ABII71_00370 [Candidatus Micrarchaeota archaeon]